MRLPIIATALACLVTSAFAQEPNGEAWPCLRFEGVGISGTLTLDEDRTKATMEVDGASTGYDLTGCGIGTASLCGANPDDPDATLTLAFISGRLSSTDTPPADFVLVDGMWQFSPMCEE